MIQRRQPALGLLTTKGFEMPLSARPELARLIVSSIKAYAIVVLSPKGEIIDWLGDAEALMGYTRDDVIGRHFEILFTAADRAAGIASAEIAMARSAGRAEDSRWHIRRNGERFWANGLTLSLGETEPVLVKIFRDETPAKRAEEQRVLLLNELNHRVKNTLATVQSVVEQTLRAADVPSGVRSDLVERIQALARAHNVLVDQNWAGADLDVLVRDVARPYDGDPSPFDLDGPRVRLHPSQAVTLSLALHELATNAAKYGALSAPGGQVRITWNLAHNGSGQRFLTLLWEETGGPKVEPPSRSGFGSRLIRQTFGDAEGGRANLQFSSAGVRCAMSLQLVDVEEGTTDKAGDDPGVAAVAT